ncbi:hypothetical protein C8A03DRAFT_36915 [Achaetomium macrosporum]|uniref:Uncharacterized protein n=1 Tax=Achaetomium macrosporum TaxID=79813 RepID=A0AAN7H8K1_9PEZI|nr:hypothetical protein C8A03DRAFT_36915 [Achaetomium macrosporum]
MPGGSTKTYSIYDYYLQHHKVRLQPCMTSSRDNSARNTSSGLDNPCERAIHASMPRDSQGRLLPHGAEAEAQLRGIPVIASNGGGLPEAKIGLPYCIPVKAVTGKRYANGDYVIPWQDIATSAEALEQVMADL